MTLIPTVIVDNHFYILDNYEGEIMKDEKEKNMKMSFEYENVDTSDLSYTLTRKLTSIGLKVIRVPIRMSGVSSQGEWMQCHMNVKRIVQKYGGKRLIGHTLHIDKDGIESIGHSVWITPENKVVCICKVNRSQEELKKGYVLFIPRMIDENPDSVDKESINYDFWITGKRFFAIHPYASKGNPFVGGVRLKNARQWVYKKYHYSLEGMSDKNTYLEDVSRMKLDIRF